MIICECKGLTDTQIRALIGSGVDTLAGLEAVTGVTSECGDCRELLVALLCQEAGGAEVELAAAAPSRPEPAPGRGERVRGATRSISFRSR